MWTPDIRTLFLIIFLLNAFLTLMLFTFWKTQKTYYGFRTWMLSLLVISCGYFLLMLRGSVSDLITIVIANLLIMLSVVMRVDATRRYIWSRPVPLVFYTLLIPAGLLYVYFTVINDGFMPRTLISFVVTSAGLMAAAIFALQPQDPESRSLRLAFSGTLIAVVIFQIVRDAYWLANPADQSLFSTDSGNTIFFVATIITDILTTGFFLMLNMVRSQTELKSSEERYRNLADNLPDYVIIHDGKTMRYANPAAGRLVGMNAEDLAGQPIYDYLTDKSSVVVESVFERKHTRDTSLPTREIELRLPGGDIRRCMVKSVMISDRGEPAVLSVITDITERKTAEDALARANKKLNILSSITRHDIRNQLSALKSYLALSKETLNDTSRVAGYIRKEETISDTIERQINFTGTYQDMGVTAPAWQNVQAGVLRAVAALPMRNVKAEVDRTDLEVYADPLFEKVSYNLIDNALRYGGDRLTMIRIMSQETGAGLVLCYEDDGAGISPEDKKHLFERGFGKNTGLGLFLSREILSITGITIAETSEPGNGARFEITVPKGEYRFGPP
ncbi:MAG: PAS domain S-box protein [Methanoregula sp.]|jgi:PAS domain S-box-containing protein|uniref:PAS domain S-box protein n=1 Tax=Methanoregula sp. TaxID=2052170 RepID=UPI003C773330